MITMGRPKKNQIRLTDSDVKYLKSLMRKKVPLKLYFHVVKY